MAETQNASATFRPEAHHLGSSESRPGELVQSIRCAPFQRHDIVDKVAFGSPRSPWTIAMSLELGARRNPHLPKMFEEYFRAALTFARRFMVSTVWFLKGDKRLLISTNRSLGPVAYFGGTMALCVAIIKALFPDDPIKTFDNPAYFNAIGSILSILPLPMFTFFAAFIVFVNIPMYSCALILKRKPRISRIIAASVYSISISFLFAAVVAPIREIVIDAINTPDGPTLKIFDNAFSWISYPVIAFIIFRSIAFMSIAHGMKWYLFMILNVIVTGIPLTIIDDYASRTSIARYIVDVFNPRPIKLFNISSASMEPTFPVGSHVIANKLIGIHQIKAGDVVVFYRDDESSAAFVSRIIGKSGDKIRMKNGVLHLNNTPVKKDEFGIYRTKDAYGRNIDVPMYIETLANGTKYRIIEADGDNGHWDNTEEYTVPTGHMFLLGDNRDRSSDSRDSNFMGYVPISNIIGKIYFITRPRDLGYVYKEPKRDR